MSAINPTTADRAWYGNFKTFYSWKSHCASTNNNDSHRNFSAHVCIVAHIIKFFKKLHLGMT